MKKKKSRKIGKFVVIALIVLGVLVYFFVPPVNATMNNILKMFASGSLLNRMAPMQRWCPSC